MKPTPLLSSHQDNVPVGTPGQRPNTASTNTTANDDAATAATNANAAPIVNVQGGRLYYCWSHGLSLNARNLSGTCTHRNDGHIVDATVFNMQGGCAEIKIPQTGGTGGACRRIQQEQKEGN
jgi:hypothetical protein